MRKYVVIAIVFSLIVFMSACAKKKPEIAPVQTEKVATPVEKIEESAPRQEKPTLSEEELFQQKSLEELNRQGLLKRIIFDYDKYQIRDDMKPVLQGNADWLLKFKPAEILIEGHCDERGTVEYNIALGEKRAEATKNYLASLGVAPSRIKFISYGKSKPLVAGNDETAYSQNRRSEFVITKK
jgi:peptidoglycan-associated lipoprotein